MSHLQKIYDLVEITKLAPTVELDIKYATSQNFVKEAVYPLARCYLRKKVAQKIAAIQKELSSHGLGLKIFDGYRPLSVSRRFWEILPDERYVANPSKGSRHNRGSAVDLTLIDLTTGQELAMPSAFDDFSEKAHRNYNRMPSPIKENCKLLEDIMVKYGFLPWPLEWWHFDDEGWQQYPLLDISFEALEQK